MNFEEFYINIGVTFFEDGDIHHGDIQHGDIHMFDVDNSVWWITSYIISMNFEVRYVRH